MNTRFQLSLMVTILVLSLGIFLFGWAYLASINNKYESILLSPEYSNQRISVLEEENKSLRNRILAIEQNRTVAAAELNTAQPTSEVQKTGLNPGGEIPADQENKKDLFVDERCVANSANLNECDILGAVDLSSSIRVVIKPNGELFADGANSITFEVQENGKKYATLNTTTVNLQNTLEPMAVVVMTAKNDITIQTKVGINNALSTYTFDGQGWIDYSKFSQQ